MDHKKEYENKLELAKEWYNDPATTTTEKERLEAIFPELEESEDERIRKWCISHFKECFRVTKDNAEYQEYLNNKVIPWLEKQGSQNLANSAKTCKDEQQPTNKVEPKFKVGDWLIGNNIVVKPCCITQIHKPYYYLTNENSFIKFGEEDKYHLWTIQDAKDGDVLVASDGSIFLFKCTIDLACKHYVALTTDDVVKFNEGFEHYWEASTGVHPATKEQRDLLFKKMREAGYEWDAEKKELKKIEQNPAWSEEDWDYYAAIIAKLEVTQDDALLTDNQMEFLRSLKNRVLPQPKQEWKSSDEQIRPLEYAIDYFRKKKNDTTYLESLYQDLMKLREE